MSRDDFILICMGIFDDSNLTELMCDFVINDDELVCFDNVLRLQESVTYVPRIV